jgi:hypothetical protein
LKRWDNEKLGYKCEGHHIEQSHLKQNHSDVFIEFETERGSWFFIEISYPSDSFRFIADGESGLDAFADFDPSDLQENKRML